MKKGLIVLCCAAVLPAAAWAQSEGLKEIAQIAATRAKAYEQGDANGWAASYAENAVFMSSDSPFKIEGRTAIRAYFAEHFTMYPGARRYAVRQLAWRTYGDNVAAADGYYELTTTDRAGKRATAYGRVSVVYVKMDGSWQIIGQHNAPLAPMQAP